MNMQWWVYLVWCLVAVQTINQRCNPTINGNDTCPENAYCMENHFCACQSGFIGDCQTAAHNLSDQLPTTHNLTKNNITLFSVTPNTTEQYVVLVFQFCHSEAVSSNKQVTRVWDDDGDKSAFTPANIVPNTTKFWEIQQGCVKVGSSLMMFSAQPNGLPENFILGLTLDKEGTVPLTISVNIEIFALWDLLLKVLIILGSVFGLAIILSVAFFIYKWRRRRRFLQLQEADRDTSHIEEYMPRFKGSEKSVGVEETCSVCLVELEEKDWLRETVCGHIFHQECLDEWCRSNLSCPLCRKSLRRDDLAEQQTTYGVLNRSQVRQSLLS